MSDQPMAPLGKYPQPIDCPHCHKKTTTFVRPVCGLLAWLLCIFLAIWCVCCCDSFKDMEHYCSQCNGFVGKYKRL
uniref:LITAF domain-containing protein n=1 Tax=Globodera rostochiensis TaxID=31243 RepID=A0A914H6Y0_GLORO